MELVDGLQSSDEVIRFVKQDGRETSVGELRVFAELEDKPDPRAALRRILSPR